MSSPMWKWWRQIHCRASTTWLKYERRRTQAERENTVVIVVTHPCDAKKMVVVWVDRTEAEGVPNVCLCEEAAAAETHNDFDGIVYGDIVEGVVLLVNAVVDAAGNWSGQVVDQSELSVLFGDYA